MVTITVSLPPTEKETVKLIETMTKEKGYKLLHLDVPNKLIQFEINKNFEEQAVENVAPQLLLD